jgi:7-alpha-hydroxysteroid dehydrogenase
MPDVNESGKLAGRHALVTGAGRGIGAEVARTLAAAGARVTLVARTASDVQAVAAMIERDGGSAAAIAADLNDVSALGPLVGAAVARWGGLDFLVHNAGGAAPAPFEATTAGALNAAFHFNVAAPFELTKAAAGHLRERPGAAIVTITSMMGHIAGRGLITYGTVKAAADHMMRQLAVELAPRIRVNAVAPGIIATGGLTAAVPPDVRDRIAAGTPLRRLGSEQDVAAAVRWLLSADASFITGKVIEVDGGADRPLIPQ